MVCEYVLILDRISPRGLAQNMNRTFTAFQPLKSTRVEYKIMI
jgi:hypothetical protein